jgi:hypothetical protein
MSHSETYSPRVSIGWRSLYVEYGSDGSIGIFRFNLLFVRRGHLHLVLKFEHSVRGVSTGMVSPKLLKN